MVHEKKVVEDVSGWIRIFDDGSVDRTWMGPPELKFLSDPVPPHEEFIDGVATKDVVIDASTGLKVRIYLPEKIKEQGQENSVPVILHLHGGGFCLSEPNWYMYYATYSRLARSAGAIIVSVYLRRAPEHRLPAACDDGSSALLWLRDLARGKAEEESWIGLHADFSRVFLIGDSSGATILFQVALRAGDEDLSPMKLAGAIQIHPGFHQSEISKSEFEQPESPFLTFDMVEKLPKLALPVGSNRDHPIICPMGDSAPKIKDLNLPPILYFVAEHDLMKDAQLEFYEAMKKAEKEVKLLINPGGVHCFYLDKINVIFDPNTAAATEKLISAIGEFINEH